MKIDFEETINIGFINVSLDLDPHDFLDCDTSNDLKSNIKEYYYENPNGDYGLGDVYIDDSEVDVTIPDKFIEEWKKLKTNEDSK